MRFLPLPLALLLGACAHPAQKPATNPLLKPDEQIGFLLPSFRASDGTETRGPTTEEADRHNAAVFARQNAAWRVPTELQDISQQVVRNKFSRRQTILKLGRLRLDLTLGEQYQPDGSGSGWWRTHSQYALKSTDGHTLAEAESMLATGLDESIAPRVEAYPAADGKSVLIIESREGTGTNSVLFTQRPDKDRWEARGVEIPIRETPWQSPMAFSRPQVVGIRDGKVYLLADDVMYALPYAALKESRPGFSIG